MLLGATAILPPTVCGAEAEIYVISGPDGIEIFSNLPRGSLPVPTVPALPAKGQGAFVVAPPAHLPEVAGRQGSDAEVAGKSFLQDD